MSVEQPPAITCTLEAQRSSGSLRLRGAILSREPASGRYRLEVVKESGSGASRIRQAGNFAADGNVATLVGSTSVDFTPGARIKATLTVNAADKTFECHFDEESF